MVVRRRAPGKNGGRPVARSFSFAPLDGQKYPSESVAIRTNRLPDDPNYMPSWSWAMSKMSIEKCWLVVRIDGATDEDKKRALTTARASLWRAAKRREVQLTSEYIAPNLYVGLVD